MTSRNRWVTVEERFAPRVRAATSAPEIHHAVAVRLENALNLKIRLEKILGRPLYEILEDYDFL